MRQPCSRQASASPGENPAADQKTASQNMSIDGDPAIVTQAYLACVTYGQACFAQRMFQLDHGCLMEDWFDNALHGFAPFIVFEHY